MHARKPITIDGSKPAVEKVTCCTEFTSLYKMQCCRGIVKNRIDEHFKIGQTQGRYLVFVVKDAERCADDQL